MEEHVVVISVYVTMITVVKSQNYISIKITTKYRLFLGLTLIVFPQNFRIILPGRMKA